VHSVIARKRYNNTTLTLSPNVENAVFQFILAKVIVIEQEVKNVKFDRPIINRYPSFSNTKSSVPSHKVKARPTVKPKQIVHYPYPNFDHVKHKIDDVNTLPKQVVQPREQTYVRLPSYSHVGTTIPKKRQGRLARARCAIRRLNGMCRALVNPGHKYSSSQAQQKHLYGTQQSADVLVGSNGHDAYEASQKTADVSDASPLGQAEAKTYRISEMQRKRIALVFQGGSRLFRTPFRFLNSYTHAD